MGLIIVILLIYSNSCIIKRSRRDSNPRANRIRLADFESALFSRT